MYMIFDVIGSDTRVTAWVTELATGKPVHQAIVSLADKKNETNDQGLCTLGNHQEDDMLVEEEDDNELFREAIASAITVGGNREKNKDHVLVVKKNDDQCILRDIQLRKPKRNRYIWHLFNDRGLYKPKDEVHVKGYARFLKIQGDARLPFYVQGVVEYTVYDSRYQRLQQSKVELNDYGAFDIKFTLPDNVNLGQGRIDFKILDKKTETRHHFQVQEFRRPEYEVSSSTRPSSIHYSHSTDEEYVVASCQGKLFAGGYLSDANVQWTVKAETTTFTPPNRSDYIFGRARPFFCWYGIKLMIMT